MFYNLLIQGEYIFEYFLIYFGSAGRLNDIRTFQAIFSKMKPKLSTLEKRYRQSGHHSSGEELDEEIFDRYICFGKTGNKDYLLYYCWLEWKTHLNDCAWLSRFDVSVDDNDDRKVKKPKKDDIHNTFADLRSAMSQLQKTSAVEEIGQRMQNLLMIIQCPLSTTDMIEAATKSYQDLKRSQI